MDSCLKILMLAFVGLSFQEDGCFLGNDIAIVFDLSGNSTKTDVENVFKFFQKLVDIMEEDTETTVALLTYANQVRSRFFFDDNLGIKKLRDICEIIERITDSNTTTHRGLLMLLQRIFDQNSGDRPDKKDLVIIITNRPTSDPVVTAQRAKNLKDTGVTILVCSVGNQVTEEELNLLATSPQYIVAAETFEDLAENVVNDVQAAVFNCMELVFQATPGTGKSVYRAWNYPGPINENNTSTFNQSGSSKRIYRSSVIDQWDNLVIDQVRVALYSNGERKSFFVFNGTSSNRWNWFSGERLLATSETGLKGGVTNIFSLEGDAGKNRRFFISNDYRGCTRDLGWLVVVDTGDVECNWSVQTDRPYFLYTPTGGPIRWTYGICQILV